MPQAPPSLLAALGATALLTGCAPRLADDIFRLDGLAPPDRLAIEQERGRVPTGGTTSQIPQPRFVYLQGALVDTNRARWFWIAGAAPAPPAVPPPLPEPRPAPPEAVP